MNQLGERKTLTEYSQMTAEERTRFADTNGVVAGFRPWADLSAEDKLTIAYAAAEKQPPPATTQTTTTD